MIPYLVLLLSVVMLAYVGRIPRVAAVRSFSIAAVSLILILFAGLRDFRVGTDTGNYVQMFLRSESYAAATGRDLEFGFTLLSWLARSLSDSYATLLLAISTIVVTCCMRTIAKLVPRYETAVFLFVALGVYTFFFNGARQGLAAAISFAALPYLLERRWIPYVALVLVAMLFHQTAFIALPLYFVAARTVSWKQLLLIVVATLLVVASLRSIVDLAAALVDDKFAAYGQAGEGGGAVFAAFLLAQGVALYALKSRVHDPDRVYARLLNVYLLGLVPVIASVLASVNASGVLRLHLYFSSTAILLWPMVFRNIHGASARGLFAMGFLAVMLTFYVLTTSTFSNLVPYMLNTEIIK